MQTSTSSLSGFLAALRLQARAQGLTDAQWAERAAVRHETLSRLQHRETCDLRTLRALARVVGAELELRWAPSFAAAGEGEHDPHVPAAVTRADEERLAVLCASRDADAASWLRHGPAFFMAGLAMLLASLASFDRRRYCELAERLHPGSSQPGVFALWLARSPLRPSRFVPLLQAELADAA